METVISKVITEKCVTGSEFDFISDKCGYDKETFLVKIEDVQASYEKYKASLTIVKQNISKLKRIVFARKVGQAEKSYIKVNSLFQTLQRNVFYIYVAMPMNAVYYDYFLNSFDKINMGNDYFEQIKQYSEHIELFIDHLFSDSENSEEIMNRVLSYKEL